MRYMVRIYKNEWRCFDSDEMKEVYEQLGMLVIDLANWAF